MANAILFISYKLKKGSSVQEFLDATEKLNTEVVSKKKGYVSWQQLKDGDTWADVLTFETVDDAKEFERSGGDGNPLADKFYSFISFPSCTTRYYTVERNY
ncbi:MAG: hypothetical protein FWD92_04760 [Methanomassiliicoccaceae archaeon]|nr:hypothetical protein [Methanomassiliicoccaceae archaeon]